MTDNRPIVSVIMAVFNAEKFIEEAIHSVLCQSYTRFELIIVDDGSADSTVGRVNGFDDSRIQLIEIEHGGVSKARNTALKEMKGDYFCFFDGDDILPPNSLSARLAKFVDAKIDYVDGCVQYMSESGEKLDKKYLPSFYGNPYKELIRLKDNCMFGNTWMIRVRTGLNYSFDERFTHSEDLLFYLKLSLNGGIYHFTDDVVLNYRVVNSSAMRNLDGLASGYSQLITVLRHSPYSLPFFDLIFVKLKTIKIMVLSNLAVKRYFKAILHSFKILLS